MQSMLNIPSTILFKIQVSGIKTIFLNGFQLFSYHSGFSDLNFAIAFSCLAVSFD